MYHDFPEEAWWTLLQRCSGHWVAVHGVRGGGYGGGVPGVMVVMVVVMGNGYRVQVQVQVNRAIGLGPGTMARTLGPGTLVRNVSY